MTETYRPVLLQRMAKKHAQRSGKAYISVLDKYNGSVKASDVFNKPLKRPWVLLFRESIVLIAFTYLSIIYGTVYMLLGAYGVVFQEKRGWCEGIGGPAFLGLAIGMLFGLLFCIYNNGRYKKLGETATPEDRLPEGMIGAIALPIGIFGFAWTNYPSIHWSACIIMSSSFGFGSVPIFLSCLNYLIDSYTMYAASVLAAGAILRSLFGAAFPLFTTQMYARHGIRWASSIPAILTLACLPFPVVMYKYGAGLTMKSKSAQEAAIIQAKMQTEAPDPLSTIGNDSSIV